MFKSFIQKKLEGYVKAYFKAHSEVKLVVVTGSVGKTSTKLAIATVLNEKYRVRLHVGNHNSELSSPLAILGIEFPDSLRNIRQWLTVFKSAKERIAEPSDVDVIVQELGTDGAGQVPHFGTYLNPDVAVVTAVAPEHMEFFKDMETVAKEELASANFSKLALINKDDINGDYAKYLTNEHINTYGTSGSAEYHFIDTDFSIEKGHTGELVVPEWEKPVKATIKVVGEHNLRPAIAAGAVGIKLGLSSEQIAKGLAKVRAVSGRMNVLEGVEDSIIIDDTYNSSPLAVSSALKALYALNAPQKIAVLGTMNELGASSEVEHTALGMLCDPSELAWVVTVGDQAEQFIATAAKKRGCQVRSFMTSLEAGSFVHSVLEHNAIVLFKGSQNKGFLEEGVKILLHSTEDESQLVRQSPEWMRKKNSFFESVSK
jgi:UDP-N-acetylmuramoyl-tripeptide--D-alanyl-D-alanine ligase